MPYSRYWTEGMDMGLPEFYLNQVKSHQIWDQSNPHRSAESKLLSQLILLLVFHSSGHVATVFMATPPVTGMQVVGGVNRGHCCVPRQHRLADIVAEEWNLELPEGTWGTVDCATPLKPRKASNQSALSDTQKARENGFHKDLGQLILHSLKHHSLSKRHKMLSQRGVPGHWWAEDCSA